MQRRNIMRMAIRRALDFETLVADIFKRLGYNVRHDDPAEEYNVDLIVEKDGERRAVETSAVSAKNVMSAIQGNADRLKSLFSFFPEIGEPLVVVSSALTKDAKIWARAKYGVEIWDYNNLHRLTSRHRDLRDRLKEFKVDLPSHESQQKSISSNEAMQEQLTAHSDKNDLTPAEFESLCLSVFTHLFDPHLYGFEKQAETSDGGNRYDFICRIRPGNHFWDSIRSDFRTKAILFECKNYNDPITADQVYSTERYLFLGALRTVCFLIARLGPSASAIRAAQGAMRESGKLIILLSNADLVEMLKLKAQPGAAENYLDKKIWDFIISLPR